MFDDEFLELEVLRILGSREAGQIRIELDGFTVDGAKFDRVGRAIASHRIRLQTTPTLDHVALYDPDEDTFSVPWTTGRWIETRDEVERRRRHPEAPIGRARLGTIADGALIIHEAVHAMRDLEGASIEPAVDEGIAYVAQAYWLLLNSTPPVEGRPGDTSTQAQAARILGHAYGIAAALHMGNPVTPDQRSTLHASIQALEVVDHGRRFCPYASVRQRDYRRRVHDD